MKAEIIKHVASFLEACPSQVKFWDGDVIDHLVKDPTKLHAFKIGCDTKKWDIYHSIKYRPAQRTRS